MTAERTEVQERPPAGSHPRGAAGGTGAEERPPAQGVSARMVRWRHRLAEAMPGSTPLSPRERRWWLVVIAVGAGLRLAWILYATRPAVGLHDPSFYTIYGGQIAEGHGYSVVRSFEPTAYYPVGYPAVLGALFWLLGTPESAQTLHMASALLNLFLGVGLLVLLFEVARRLFDNTTALVATGIVALWPNLIFHTAVALTEGLFNFLVMAAVLVLVAARWRDRRFSWQRLALFGAILALSIYVRPISALFLPVLLLVWLLAGFGWRRTIQHLGVIAVALVVVLAPWTIRNFFVMDAFVLVSTNFGDNFCMGRQPGATGGFKQTDYCLGGYEGTRRPEYEILRNERAFDQGLDYMLEHPLQEVRLLFWRSYYTVHNDYDGLDAAESYGDDRFVDDRWRSVLETTANAFFFVVTAFALVSVPTFLRRGHPGRAFFLLAGASLAAAPLIFFGDVRFHVPVAPFLAVGAAAALVTARRVLREDADLPGGAPAAL